MLNLVCIERLDHFLHDMESLGVTVLLAASAMTWPSPCAPLASNIGSPRGASLWPTPTPPTRPPSRRCAAHMRSRATPPRPPAHTAASSGSPRRSFTTWCRWGLVGSVGELGFAK